MRPPDDASLLRQPAADAIRWLTQDLPRFAPQNDGTPRGASVKRLAELALAYIQLESWSKVACRERCAVCAGLETALPRWRRFLIEQCEMPAYAEHVRKVPARGLDTLLPYLALRARGYRYEFHEESLRRLEESGLLDVAERGAYRLLEAKWILWQAGWSVSEPEWRELYLRTSLARRRRLSYVDTIAAYTATHTVFYITDFGTRVPGYLAHEAAAVTEVLTSSLIHYWRVHHWDLVAECLLALACVNEQRSSLEAAAENALTIRWHKGRLPATRDDENECQHRETAPRGESGFRACYHSSLVGILAVARRHYHRTALG